MSPHLSVNVIADLRELLAYHFMVNALLGGSLVALSAAPLGWFMVLRSETFAGHTLSMMAFPGASGAALAGIGAAWGYFFFCLAGALAIGGLTGGRSGEGERSANIGTIQAVALAVGFLLLSLYGGVLSDLENLLFGDLLGISDGQLITICAVSLCSLGALSVFARPLLFASVDTELARARGVPVRALSTLFLIALALAVAAISQITGVLLVFALLVAPAASAQVLSPRPLVSLLLSVLFALLIVWLGLGIAYFSSYPAGFYIASVAFVLYLVARLASLLSERRPRRRDQHLDTAQIDGAIG